MRRNRPSIVLVSALVICVAGGSAAAAQGGARLQGTVRDWSGGMLPGVTITVTGVPPEATGAAAASKEVPPGATETADAGSSGRVPAVGVTDSEGAFQFTDLRPGRYALLVSLAGFEEQQDTLNLGAGESVVRAFVLSLARLVEVVEVTADQSVTGTRVATGAAHLDARVLEAAPLASDRIEDALPLLPSTIRGPDGLLNMNGTRASQSTLLVNGINGTDPVTGQSAIRLPVEAVQALDVQAGIHSAQFGGTTGGVTNVVTRSGSDVWDVQFQNFLPRIRFTDGGIRGLDAFTPRLRLAGPVRRGRVWFAETANYRFVRTRVNELEPLGLDRSEQQVTSFDSLTQIDVAVRDSRRVVGTFLWFPSDIDNVQIDTLRPFDATPNLTQRGWNAGIADHIVAGRRMTIETSLSAKAFDVEVAPKSSAAARVTVIGVADNYFNRFDRDSRRYDAASALSASIPGRAGDHFLTYGGSVAYTSYSGVDASLPILVTRADGSVAQRIEFVGDPGVGATSAEWAAFVQEQWAPTPRVTARLGVRYAYEGISGNHTLSPRMDLSIQPRPDDGTLLKAGYGRFYDKLPLNARDFVGRQHRRTTVFPRTDAGIAPEGTDRLNQVAPAGLQTPVSDTWNLELARRLALRLVLRLAYHERHGRQELLVDVLERALSLSSRGRSRSRNLEVTVGRQLSREGQVTVSYVRSEARGDLNDFGSLFGTVRDPVVRPNEFSRQPFDAPNRVLAWGVINLPWRISLAPTLEYRTGFPYSVVEEGQQVVGVRNEGGRLPAVFTLDLSATTQIRLTRSRRARVGLQFFNLTNHFNPRDVQNNIASGRLGEFANSVDRQVRLKFAFLF